MTTTAEKRSMCFVGMDAVREPFDIRPALMYMQVYNVSVIVAFPSLFAVCASC